ncbi:MAG: bacterioferritin comigratory protein [Bacteroidetes bacterium]|nr:bacterioferritin comigratory protein [Bacteroidota bacterium]
MAELKVGDKAPDFTLPTGAGERLSLKDMKGKKVVLYFYSKDDTSGCTKEACSFRDNIKVIQKKGAVVIGASIDSVESHKKFATRYDLPFTLVSDQEKDLVKKYGVWKEKRMYGRKYMGVVRTTFLIDEKGVISHIFPKVNVEGHTDEILALL